MRSRKSGNLFSAAMPWMERSQSPKAVAEKPAGSRTVECRDQAEGTKRSEWSDGALVNRRREGGGGVGLGWAARGLLPAGSCSVGLRKVASSGQGLATGECTLGWLICWRGQGRATDGS